MEQVYTVSQVNSYIKSIIAREYVLGSIIIRERYLIANIIPQGIYISHLRMQAAELPA